MNYHYLYSVSEHLFPHIRCCRTYCVSSIVFQVAAFQELFEQAVVQYFNMPPLNLIRSHKNYPKVYALVPKSINLMGCCRNLQLLFGASAIEIVQAFRDNRSKMLHYFPKSVHQIRSSSVGSTIDENIDIYTLICGTINPTFENAYKTIQHCSFAVVGCPVQLEGQLALSRVTSPVKQLVGLVFPEGASRTTFKTFLISRRLEQHLSKEQPLSQWHGERAALGMKVTCLGRSNSTEFRRARTPDARPLSMYQSTRLSGTLQRDVRTEQQAEIAFRQRYGLVAPSSILTRVCAYFGFVLASYSQLIIEFIILPLDRLAIVANQCDNSGCFLTEFPRPLLSRYSLPSMQQVAKLSKGLGLKCSPLLNEIAATSRFSCCESSLGNAFIEVQLLCKGAIKTIYEGIMQLHTDNNRGIRLNRREVQIAILMKNRLHVKNFISMELDCESERYGPITKERIRQLLVFSRDVRMIFEPQTARSILFGSETLIDPVSSTDLLVGFMARNDRTELDQLKIATIRLLADIDDISALEDVHDAFYRAVIECGPATCVLSMFE
uniref:Uncharacterized protein n=1 Tax=Spironucleus salmonicida TaxID=348837 RepID=V6LSQ6_9EUKA|eukprot:EST47662.1 Hypothetical protein SS50377_12248 [Spironucleus salmonicida]